MVCKYLEKSHVFLKTAKELFYVRENIINYFKKGIFSYKGNVFKTKEKKSEKESEQKLKDDLKNFIEYIKNESKGIDYDSF